MHAGTRLPPAVSDTAPLTLYFAPLACSLASRIVCYEAGLDVRYVEVDTGKKRVVAGGDFFAVNPLGQVPVLEIGDDLRLTENSAVLQYLADRAPRAGLLPVDRFARARVQQWLGFIGTELHKAVFVPLLSRSADAAVRDDARRKIALRMDFVEGHLAERPFLVGTFTVADAYLATVLNWARTSGVDLDEWPATAAWHRSLLQRPQVARAVGEEFALWKARAAA